MTQNNAYLSILQITDMHILRHSGETLVGIDTEHYFHAILELAFSAPAQFDLVLMTGDLAQTPCQASYQRILNRIEAYPAEYVCLAGNHDDFELMQTILNTERVSCRKHTVLGNWQIICLNSQIPGAPGGHLAARELEFLDACLREHPGCPALIAVHHHCQKTGSVWMDGMMIDNSPEFFAVITKYPEVKAVICGHIHQALDDRAGSVHLLGTPSTCFQFTPGSSHFSVDDAAPGYRVIELYADGRIKSKISRLSVKLTGLKLNGDSY